MTVNIKGGSFARHQLFLSALLKKVEGREEKGAKLIPRDAFGIFHKECDLAQRGEGGRVGQYTPSKEVEKERSTFIHLY